MIEYLIFIATFTLIWVILAVSYDFSFGYAGILNLGHVGFFAIGAYTSGLLMLKLQFPFILAFFTAAILTAIVGALLAVITKRISKDYFALTTLGFHFVVIAIITNWTSLTGGALGLSGIPLPSIFGYVISPGASYLVFTLIVTVLAVGVMWVLVKSPFGILLQASRDDPIGLEVLGRDSFKIKIKALTISAFFAGVAGSLFAHYMTFISYESFGILDIILVLTMILVGGVSNTKGAIFGAVLISILLELARFVPVVPEAIGPVRQIVYSLVLVIILLYRPRGILGRVDVL